MDKRTIYCERNEAIRFEMVDKLDDGVEGSLRVFLRRVGLPHLFDELFLPTMRDGAALLGLAIRDRPWPPWGIGGQIIHALLHVNPIAEGSASLSDVFVTHENAANVGLMTALYKETLEQLVRRGVSRVNYLVAEGAAFAPRMLSAVGFKQVEGQFLTEQARYLLHQAEAKEVLERLGLAKAYTPDLLAHRIDDGAYERNALFHLMTQVAMRPYWHDLVAIPEMVVNLGLLLRASLPGGTGGTKGPPKS
jgi:hypothetical protein